MTMQPLMDQLTGEEPGFPGEDAAVIPAVCDLRAAHNEHPDRFMHTRRAFERTHQCTITDEYYAKHINAAALLLRMQTQPRDTIRFYYSGGADVRVDTTIGKLHALHLVSSTLLSGRYQEVAARRTYADIVTLMSIVDGCKHPRSGADDTTEARIEAGLAAATDDFTQTREFILDLRRRTTLSSYILGFPAGVALVGALAALAVFLLTMTDTEFFVRGLIFGAIGAIISAMVRITRGQELFVDVHEGRGITMLAGAFRPVIGAVFGVIIYVLANGGLLPFISAPPDPGAKAFFFMGLAFLAGFSERWAQDTIIQSTPKAPSSMREAVPPPGGKAAADVPQRTQS